MPLWDFRRESTVSAAGANTLAGTLRGQAPFVGGDFGQALAEKRNVIITSLGWVRRENRGTRQIDQVIVAGSPGTPNIYYNSNTYTGQPDIVQIYVKLNANGYMSANATNANLYVVFNAPITWKASGNLISITVANTAGGNNAVARFANSVIQGRIVNANNTLVFRLPKLQANNAGSGVSAATYKVNAQTLSVTGNPLYNPDWNTTVSANLVLTGAVSNTLSDGWGQKITTFQVRLRG